MSDSRMIDVEDLEPGETVVMRLEDREERTREAILLGDGNGGVRAWINECQHLPDVPLDRGDGATIRDSDIVCERHGAHYDIETGECTVGPCTGAILPTVEVAVRDGAVVLTDEEYTFQGTGPEEEPGPRSSGGAVGF